MQAAAYQITLDRVVGEHRLPENCIVIAAGNRTTDKSVAFKMPKALANRVLHIEVEGSFRSWKEWAIGNGINDKVIGFLSFRQNYLMGFDSSSDDLAFATPRSWEMVSNLLNHVSDDVERMYAMIAGLVGCGVAVEFRTWAKVYRQLPEIKDIFDGKSPSLPTNTDAMYALIAAMVAYAREHKNELSRMRILISHGFYGLLLMHMTYSVDEEVETACTDGVRITFGIKFLESLTDEELDFVMMHEILHVVLQHCQRGEAYDHEAFNTACDIVVNSNILLENNMNCSSITLAKYGESMHLAPNGKEGYEYPAEQVYEMLSKNRSKRGKSRPGGSANGRAKQQPGRAEQAPTWRWDDHSRWGMYEEDATLRDVWVKRFEDAAEAISIRDPSNTRGLLPLFAKRILGELKKAQTDWRTVLNDFIQEEVVDYSFFPPDRRFDDSPFFLPDFNGKEDLVEDILFMIDTSGSMSDAMITTAYSEIKGAIDQFDGKLKGWLGFFDAAIIEPKPFSNEDEFRIIRPAGGGGTDFQIIFEYISGHMLEPPASLIILTDGYAPFPQEKLAMGIPVLWLLNNEEVDPPWGKVARIKVK